MARHTPALIPSTLAAYATEQDPHLSAKYVRIDTRKVIELAESAGFYVAEIKQDRPRQNGRDPRFVRHQVDFRRHSDIVTPDGATPRVIWTNSHNGTTRGVFRLGIFRQVCSNGLMVGSVWATESARHVGEDAAQILERISKVAASSAQAMEVIERWSHTPLTKDQQRALVREAVAIRFGDADRFATEPEALLAARRPADEGDSAWLVYNRLQENLSRGGTPFFSLNGRRGTTRAIGSIGNEQDFNLRLWNAVEKVLAG